jgi:Tfp pilus assembly protein PilF
VDKQPTNTLFRMRLAEEFINEGDYECAAKQVQKAIDIDPTLKLEGKKLLDRIEAGEFKY